MCCPPTPILYFYDLDAEQTLNMHRECNDYVAQLTTEHPERFAGLAHLPMQDVGAAIEELTRAVEQLGLEGGDDWRPHQRAHL